MRVLSFLFVFFAVVIPLSPTASAQSLQSPAEFLGYQLGERFTPHHKIVSYFEYISESSSNVSLESYGETNEGRPLFTAFVTSDENHASLESIRQNHLRIAGVVDGAPEGTFPGVVWLSYGVHGNESSSSEASMKTLFALASGGSDVSDWLNDTVVIMDPSLNPDGRDRYVNWFNRQVGRFPNSSTDSREHHEPWPGGRTNHYYFDLNRDWAWMTQKESQHRVAQYNKWLPHVHVDFHEQGINNPYFFAPAAEPYHNLITDGQRRIENLIGENNRQYFDANDWLYFTREQFDLLYPAYGDTWPTFNGAVGMTYEQAGGGRGGLQVENDEDHLLTLAERIDHHHTSGLSTVEAVFRNRETIIQEFANYYASAAEGVGPYKTYVIKQRVNPDNVAALTELLDGQGIRYSRAMSDDNVSGFLYRRGGNGRFAIEKGDLVIHSAQPKSRLASVLLEPRTFAADSLTYDITAWALPYAYNVDAVATNSTVQTDSAEPAKPVQNVQDESYAYLLSWNGRADVRVLSELLSHSVRLRIATNAFTIDGATYHRGTLIVTGADNKHLGEELADIVEAAAVANDQPVASVQTGFVDTGNDIGSSKVAYLNGPRVMLVTGTSISSSAIGELWNYFDNEINYPVSLVNGSDLSGVSLDDYEVIILPSGSYGSILTDSELERLTSWVRRGGRLIAIEGAIRSLDGKSGFNIKRRTNKAVADTSAASKLKPYAGRERDGQSDRVAGAIYRAAIDNTHPLAFGYNDTYFTLKRSSATYDFLAPGWNVATIQEATPVSGFAGYKFGPKIENTVLWGHQALGRGDVVYFTNDPIYRGFWHGGMLALANAIFMVGQ